MEYLYCTINFHLERTDENCNIWKLYHNYPPPPFPQVSKVVFLLLKCMISLKIFHKTNEI